MESCLYLKVCALYDFQDCKLGLRWSRNCRNEKADNTIEYLYIRKEQLCIKN